VLPGEQAPQLDSDWPRPGETTLRLDLERWGFERVYIGRRSVRITRASLERFVREQLGDRPPELEGDGQRGVRELFRRFGL